MKVYTVFRIATVVLMAATLVFGLARPDFFPALRRILVWLVPVWIGVLFVVQTLTTPDSTGTTAVERWSNRLLGKKWTCPDCGAAYRQDVPLCSECGELRPDTATDGRPWVCEVCEAENEPEAVSCQRCTVPRPEVIRPRPPVPEDRTT